MLLCSSKEIPKEEKKKNYYFALILNGVSVEIPKESILTEFERMFTKFKGDMVNEIPMCFLAVRSIS